MPDIRFIDYKYKDLFKLPDGENIVITTMEGTKKLLKCNYIDQTHTQIGNNVYHIAQFAEIARKNGLIYSPEKPNQGDICDTYEIYQLKQRTEYRFESYDFAKDKLKSSDYKRVYVGVLAPNVTLGDIYLEHNMDNRPFNMKIHSLSVSDIVAINRGNNKTAYYVDKFDFKELPDFAKALAEKPPKQKNQHER